MWLQIINSKLEQGWNADERASWKLWLVTSDYNDAPKKRTDNRFNEGLTTLCRIGDGGMEGKNDELECFPTKARAAQLYLAFSTIDCRVTGGDSKCGVSLI